MTTQQFKQVDEELADRLRLIALRNAHDSVTMRRQAAELVTCFLSALGLSASMQVFRNIQS